MIALSFDLTEHNLRTTLFGLVSNVYEDQWIDFLALRCFTGTEGTYKILTLSSNPSGVDTTED